MAEGHWPVPTYGRGRGGAIRQCSRDDRDDSSAPSATRTFRSGVSAPPARAPATYTGQPNRMAALYSQLHANIQDCFNAAGVEILSPHYRAARDGSHTTVPVEHLPPGYVAPPFLVQLARHGKGAEREPGS